MAKYSCSIVQLLNSDKWRRSCVVLCTEPYQESLMVGLSRILLGPLRVACLDRSSDGEHWGQVRKRASLQGGQ